MVFMLVNPQPVYLVAGGLFLVASLASGVAMYLQQRTGQRRRMRQERELYLEHVDRVRDEAGAAARQQRDDARRRHPAPEDLWTVAVTADRVWERRPGDEDFLHVRVGLGARPPGRRVRVETRAGPLTQVDAICAHAAHRLLTRCATVDDLPVTLDLAGAGVVAIAGPEHAARALARAVVCQAAAFHAPEDLRIVPCADDGWDWAKWLPHAQVGRPGAGPAPVIARDAAALRDLLEGEVEERRADHVRRRQADPAPAGLAVGRTGEPEPDRRGRPHLLLVLDGGATAAQVTALLGPPGGIGMTIVEVVAAPNGGADVTLSPGRGGDLAIERPGRDLETAGRADGAGPRLAESLARTLAPLRLSAESHGASPLADTVSLGRLLGIDASGELDTDRLWRERPMRERLRWPRSRQVVVAERSTAS
jgi:S-DNA-T family DNA segregation ATPase FtsK/SpoIIIE